VPSEDKANSDAADMKSFKELDVMQGKIGSLLKNLELAAAEVLFSINETTFILKGVCLGRQ
jgi:hypothetical protein